MGHAIHSILARTRFQNVSGTRCATDFSELPSTLMEHFAADPSVLSLFARHWKTNRPVPQALVSERIRLAHRFEGLDTEQQILLSLADQAFHSQHGFFGHLHSYGAGYYSYLFDRVLAERVWRKVFDAGRDGAAVSRLAGERLKEKILRWGGARDPWRCLADGLDDQRLAAGDAESMALVGSWGIKDHGAFGGDS
ncbi:Mitochondrial intermediate peptidase [Ophiocordyceps camponoti-floridani]|uniref:Mitochondrial intermediate peptidase n=1 Tax=Ophiocordyceps camponoti-floridani TaxID=2030778 RepID=A0A8H4QC38_9HYPO|nr:Mitochondrial intermediate peptidase [Ophiocordyceps camponoti-floridani]